MFLLILSFFIFILACKGKEPPKEATPVPQPQVQAAAPAVPNDVQKPTSEAVSLNHPPRVESVDVNTLLPRIGDTLKVTAKVTDPDGDDVRLSYQWLKNDEPLSETSDSLNITKDFKRGDWIAVYVTPDDGKDKGSPGLVKGTISNASPEITSSSGDSRFENGKFTYQVKATDPEGDPITYSLKTSPAGMTINPSTGLIQWNVPSDLKGKASVTVYATDNHGGGALHSFTFELASK
ncbi:MAG: putative Ig domain-containing protein [Nitrospirae bacterium]|nr:putative Ig domain-containing protein [Nitrospirota bacterium]